jgi:hypothetical protein
MQGDGDALNFDKYVLHCWQVLRDINSLCILEYEGNKYRMKNQEQSWQNYTQHEKN